MKRRRSREADTALELTPLVDGVFLLLVFFMVSTTFVRESRIHVELPEASSSNPPDGSGATIEVVISGQGDFAVGGRALSGAGREGLAAALSQALGAQVEAGPRGWPPLVIRADAGVAHEYVVRALDVAGELGFLSVRIATREPAGVSGAAPSIATDE